MPNKEQLLIETHGMVREMSGKMDTLEKDVIEAKDARRRIHERQDKMERNYVKKDECLVTEERVEKSVKAAIEGAMNGRKRSRWLVVKDILIILFGGGGMGTIIVLTLLGKLK